MKCKYWKTCKDYRNNSSTCNYDGGSDYCGVYQRKRIKVKCARGYL